MSILGKVFNQTAKQTTVTFDPKLFSDLLTLRIWNRDEKNALIAASKGILLSESDNRMVKACITRQSIYKPSNYVVSVK